MKRIIIIFIFFVLFSFVKTESVLADRLLLGVEYTGFGYVNKVDSVSDESGVQWITQCIQFQEKTTNRVFFRCFGFSEIPRPS